MIMTLIIILIILLIAFLIYAFVGHTGDGMKTNGVGTHQIPEGRLYVYPPVGDNSAQLAKSDKKPIAVVEIGKNELESESGFTVGRHPDCNLSLSSYAGGNKAMNAMGIKRYNFNNVGNVHISIAKDDKGYFIMDHKSLNGTGIVGSQDFCATIDIESRTTWFWIADVVMRLEISALPEHQQKAENTTRRTDKPENNDNVAPGNIKAVRGA